MMQTVKLIVTLNVVVALMLINLAYGHTYSLTAGVWFVQGYIGMIMPALFVGVAFLLGLIVDHV
jgi:hypothetical protein